MIHINLVPRSIRERRLVRARLQIWAGVVSSLALVLAASCAIYRFAGGAEQTVLENHGARVAERVERSEEALKQVRRLVADYRRRIDASETVGLHPDWSLLLHALAAIRGEEVVLDRVELKAVETAVAPPPAAGDKDKPVRPAAVPEVYTLAIHGYALSQGGAMKFARRIEELGVMASVHLRGTRAETRLGVEAIGFDLDCRLEAKTIVAGEAP